MRLSKKAFALAALLFPLLASAEPMTREQGDAILQELRAIRQAIEQQGSRPPAAPAAPRTLRTETLGAPVLGREDAPVTMVMFTDYECPFCRKFLVTALPQLRRELIETGKLKLVLRDLPLDMHPQAEKAAEALHCTAEQGRFWPMVEMLAAASESLNMENVGRRAAEIGVDGKRLDECVASGRYREKIAASAAEARRLGISGTPTFVIGPDRNGVVEGERVVGALPFETFKRKVEEAAAPRAGT